MKKAKNNKKIVLMKKYKQDYDSDYGPFGEKRLSAHFNDSNFIEAEELLIKENNINYDL